MGALLPLSFENNMRHAVADVLLYFADCRDEAVTSESECSRMRDVSSRARDEEGYNWVWEGRDVLSYPFYNLSPATQNSVCAALACLGAAFRSSNINLSSELAS